MRGFRSTWVGEAEEGCLPLYTNPKNPPKNLVTEQFTGPQGFTGESSSGGPLRLWLYKSERSVKVGNYQKSTFQPFQNVVYENAPPNPIRTLPPQNPPEPTDFIFGLIPYADNEHLLHYQYSINSSMKEQKRIMHNVDGEMLIQPSTGILEIITECGVLELAPGVVGVIPKNMKFQINLENQNQNQNQLAQGVITELKNDRSFKIPNKGVIGANGLANPEYFQIPVPHVDYDNLNTPHIIFCKKQNQYFQSDLQNTPFDVYAWKGNYAPYRFNLEDFVPIIAGQRDHIDPSSHILLAVEGQEGANFVEISCFVNRFNVTTDKYPTYLPPYDHRNVGKSEIMHYLGGYDAREGTLPGFQTVHEMGVAHGNDQETFLKARYGENKIKYLNFPPATMVETTGSLRINSAILKNQDSSYGDSLRGTQATQKFKPPQAKIGASKRITFTALEESIVPLFNEFMPNPDINFNKKTGLTVRDYYNSNGNVLQVRSQYDQNKFWEVYKGINKEKIQYSRNIKEASDEEVLEVTKTMRSFFQRGTVIQTLDLETENPLETANYYKNQGFFEGLDKHSVCIDENSPFSLRFIKQGLLDHGRKNEKAFISTIDHTVINVFRRSLQLMYKIFPDTFWGGDPRDLRAPGVQFDTRVLTNDLNSVPQMIPVNNLDFTEEEILHRIQENDTFLPPYIQSAAMGNQITRGLFDTNRTLPKNSKNGFLQHVAFAVNQKYGDLSDHLKRMQGVQLIPGPPPLYYDLSEVDLAQRVCLPTLFKLEGYNAFELPYLLFNGLLKPKDAKVSRLQDILKECNVDQKQSEQIISAYNKMQPVLALIGDSVLTYESSKFIQDIQSILTLQKFHYTDEDLQTIVKLVEFNKKKINKSRSIGSLIDFQIIYRRDQSGYLDQTFSVPISQKTEGTSGIFLEFIVRTCYDDIFELLKKNKLTLDATVMKSCGAFGQGNFANLMLGQQEGIKKIDQQLKQIEQQQGDAFKLPMIDLETISNNPLDHLFQYIEKCKQKGENDKIDSLKKLSENIGNIIEEAQKRKIWR